MDPDSPLDAGTGQSNPRDYPGGALHPAYLPGNGFTAGVELLVRIPMASSRNINPTLVQENLGRCGLEISEPVLRQVCLYLGLLEKWNQYLNLTGHRSQTAILENLFAESFLGARYLESNDSPCLDVGAGAGFPGMPMKMLRPELEMVLLEPRQKRSNFLSVVKRELGLTQVEILTCRLEDVVPGNFRLSPTVYVSRGLGNQAKLLAAAKGLWPGLRKIQLFTTPDLSQSLVAELKNIHWNVPLVVPWNHHHVLLRGEWV
ncbi:MAG: 16S rRNA (guanine(527)-N(7))-methyltransferase RsmG [Terriglobia bacterium]